MLNPFGRSAMHGRGRGDNENPTHFMRIGTSGHPDLEQTGYKYCATITLRDADAAEPQGEPLTIELTEPDFTSAFQNSPPTDHIYRRASATVATPADRFISPDATLPEQIGDALRVYLFSTGLSAYLKHKKVLRAPISLDLRLTPKLADLPWELLRSDECDGIPLIDVASITRIQKQSKAFKIRSLKRGQAIRVLIASSTAESVDGVARNPYDPKPEIAAILKAASRRLPYFWSSPLKVEVIPDASSEDIYRALRRKYPKKRPHVLHLMGHGVRIAETVAGGERTPVRTLLLMNRSAVNGQAVDTGRGAIERNLAEILETDESPALVVLSACETATAVDAPALAATLVQQGTKFAVGMQASVSTDMCEAFAAAFYEEIARSGRVDRAVWKGRQNVKFTARNVKHEYFAPVLYSGVEGALSLYETEGRPSPRKQIAPSPQPFLRAVLAVAKWGVGSIVVGYPVMVLFCQVSPFAQQVGRVCRTVVVSPSEPAPTSEVISTPADDDQAFASALAAATQALRHAVENEPQSLDAVVQLLTKGKNEVADAAKKGQLQRHIDQIATIRTAANHLKYHEYEKAKALLESASLIPATNTDEFDHALTDFVASLRNYATENLVAATDPQLAVRAAALRRAAEIALPGAWRKEIGSAGNERMAQSIEAYANAVAVPIPAQGRSLEPGSGTLAKSIHVGWTVAFASNEGALTRAEGDAVYALGERLSAAPYANHKVEVVAKADNSGSAAHNQALTDERAESIKKILIDAGVDPTRITTIALGERGAEGADAVAREVDRAGEIRLKMPGVNDILFDTDSDALSVSGEEIVKEMAASASQYPELDVVLEGYADAPGSEEYNKALSERRAVRVCGKLQSQGVDPQRLLIVGFGEQRLIIPTPGPEEANRRVSGSLTRFDASAPRGCEVDIANRGMAPN